MNDYELRVIDAEDTEDLLRKIEMSFGIRFSMKS